MILYIALSLIGLYIALLLIAFAWTQLEKHQVILTAPLGGLFLGILLFPFLGKKIIP